MFKCGIEKCFKCEKKPAIGAMEFKGSYYADIIVPETVGTFDNEPMGYFTLIICDECLSMASSGLLKDNPND
jgi:hypothetical protein